MPDDNSSLPTRDFRQRVTDNIIRMLEQGTAPWQKPWEAGKLEMPNNPTTEKPYRGGNAVHLMTVAAMKEYDDPRWLTYKQAAENGWQVRKGEKGTQIEYWEFPDSAKSPKQRGTENEEQLDADSKSAAGPGRIVHRVYTVFNAQQIEGIPPHQRKQLPEFEVVEGGENILRNSGATIRHDQDDRAFYNRRTDSIHLPSQAAFKTAGDYYGTALHELAHWTGHPSRLNRSTLNESYRFGDPNYAQEELRAELASVFLAAERGIPHNPEQHAAYVGSWIKALRNDKNEIFRAAKDANRAADFLMALEHEKKIESPEDSVSIQDAIRVPQSRVSQEASKQREIAKDSSRFVARFEPRSGTVGVHDKHLGNDHHSPIDLSLTDKANGNNGKPASELKESFQEARALAVKELGQEAKTYVAQTRSGVYYGKIIGETDHHLVQRVSGQTAVAHLKKLVTETPRIDSNVSIAYQDDKARVRNLPERSRAAEIAR